MIRLSLIAVATLLTGTVPIGLTVDSSTHLRPGHVYRSTIAPTLTFRVGDASWWAYQRPMSAFNLRRATGPADGQIIDDEGIEIVTSRGSLSAAVAKLRAPAGLQLSPTAALGIGSHAALCFDASGNATWNAPASLAGEQLSPPDQARVCSWKRGRIVVSALIFSTPAAFGGFVLQAQHLLAGVR